MDVRLCVALLILILLASAATAQPAQFTPEQAAQETLDGARRAYNDARYDFAATAFADFVKQYVGHREIVAAQYGLAMSLLELPKRDYAAIAAALAPAIAQGSFPHRPYALHYMGLCQRSLAEQALADAVAKPAEAVQLRASAMQKYEEAARQFAQAAGAFSAKLKVAAPPASQPAATVPATAPASPPAAAAKPAQPPAELEWAARSRCDQLDALLRAGKYKEAADAATAFLAEPALTASRYRPTGQYQLGYAQFCLREHLNAGKTLSKLAPFAGDFGPHAQFMLARVHHLANERPEAVRQYQAVLASHATLKKAAQQALANPAALKAEQKAAYAALVSGPAPDYVARAMFYQALMTAEAGQYAEALTQLAAFVQQNPKHALAGEAQLRQAFCQLQVRNFAEAIKLAQPLAANPQLADQALLYVGKAQAGAADAANAAAYDQALKAAIQTLLQSAEKAKALAATDAEAKVRRGDILLELGDTQQLAKLYKEAATTYQQALAENNNPERAEEALQRQATALHLTGQYAQSDDLCKQFEGRFPKSTLLPAVLFRTAENAYLTAQSAAADEQLPNRQAELPKLFGEAITRYQRLLKQYPEYQYASYARLGLGTCLYRQGKFAEAVVPLSGIAEPERTGDLAGVPYMLADCLIRTLPAEASDALQAGKIIEQAGQAAKLLESYISSFAPVPGAPPANQPPKNPALPDAMLKLGHCYQRIGNLLADAPERNKTLTSAREAYERLIAQYPQDKQAMPAAVFERAKALAGLGDAATALNELNRFQAEPLKGSAVAPLAIVRLAALMRSQNRAAEAVAALAACRTLHEPLLAKEPARAEWAAQLQYEHALALMDTAKPAEAGALLEGIAKGFPNRPEAANALWRVGQCRRLEAAAALKAAREAAAKAAKPEDAAAATKAVQDAVKGLGQASQAFAATADELAKKTPGGEAHLRTLYELAWSHRVLAETQLETARQKLQKETLDRVMANLAKELPAGQPAPALRPPDVPLHSIPAQPAEKDMADAYAKIIAAAPDSPLSVHARLELAEMQTQRNSGTDGAGVALELLADALEKNPPPELVDRIRLRIATAFLARNDAPSALAQAVAVLKNPNSPLAAEARYLAGEALFQQKQWPKAIETLAPFRDQPAFQNSGSLSERGLLRLGQAYSISGQHEPARQALSLLSQRFPQSPWLELAFFEIAASWQAQQQLDNAAAAYAEVIKRTASELAAKASLQSGLCRLEQKRYPEAIKSLLSVAYVYGYPDWCGPAMCEAGRAYAESGQPAEAAKLWQQVVKEYPSTPAAQAAQKGLGQIK